jgi:hypothetical protein
MAVAKRRAIRQTKSYLRSEKRAFLLAIHRAIRLVKLEIRRAYKSYQQEITRAYRRSMRWLKRFLRRSRRAVIWNFYVLPERKVRRTKMRIRRSYRSFKQDIQPFERRLERKLGKYEKQFKNSRFGGIYAGLSSGLGSSSRH